MKEPKLKPCPLCGISLKRINMAVDDDGEDWNWVHDLNNCHLRVIGFKDTKKNRDRWNQRAVESEQGNSDKVNDAIEKVFKELHDMPTEEFKAELGKHKDGPFAKIMMEVWGEAERGEKMELKDGVLMCKSCGTPVDITA